MSLYPLGARVRHHLARKPTGLGTVIAHEGASLVVERDDDGVVYTTNPVNWRRVDAAGEIAALRAARAAWVPGLDATDAAHFAWEFTIQDAAFVYRGPDRWMLQRP